MHTSSFLFIALAVVAGAAQAQDCSPCGNWSGSIGVGVVTRQRYAGSDEHRAQPFPFVQLEYKGRAFVGGVPSGAGAGVGSYLVRRGSLVWHVELSQSETRRERYGAALAGMGTRSGSTFTGTGVSYSLGFLSARANVAVGLSDEAGAFGNLTATAQKQLARRWTAGLSTGATVADARNMAYDFGITGAQATRRQELVAQGDPRLSEKDAAAYRPDAGLKQVQSTASVAYALTPRTRLMMFAQATRLSDEAARSGIVRERNSTAGGVVMAYGF